MADKGSIFKGLLERTVLLVLSRLNVDSSGRLRIAGETGTLALSNGYTYIRLANMDGDGGNATARLKTYNAYQNGCRRNIR